MTAAKPGPRPVVKALVGGRTRPVAPDSEAVVFLIQLAQRALSPDDVAERSSLTSARARVVMDALVSRGLLTVSHHRYALPREAV